MVLNKETIFTKDLANRKLKVVREFDAPLQKVWRAWTESDLLDQWWAPKPWKANTKTMDFRDGGHWLYYMEGPDGSRHYNNVNYKSVSPVKSFSTTNFFCDENGNINAGMPVMYWKTEFSKTADGTKVEVEISFDTEDDLTKIIEMGFKEGFTAGLHNLDEVLAG